MRQIGLYMRRKLRSDDLVGRFSDDRFVAVLRRLDISLGTLIARKLLSAAREGIASQPLVVIGVLASKGSGGFGSVDDQVRVGVLDGATDINEESQSLLNGDVIGRAVFGNGHALD